MKAKRKIKIKGETQRKIDPSVLLGELAGASKKQTKKLKAWLKKHNHNVNRVPPGILYRLNPNNKIGISIHIEKVDDKEIITAKCKFCGKMIDLTEY